MGEARNKESRQTDYEKLMIALSRKLADEGKIIEAGWVGLRLMIMTEQTPPSLIEHMRKAYMAGAQHLFSSMISIMDDGTDVTEADLKRMDLINKELETFQHEMTRDHYPTKGNA